MYINWSQIWLNLELFSALVLVYDNLKIELLKSKMNWSSRLSDAEEFIAKEFVIWHKQSFQYLYTTRNKVVINNLQRRINLKVRLCLKPSYLMANINREYEKYNFWPEIYFKYWIENSQKSLSFIRENTFFILMFHRLRLFYLFLLLIQWKLNNTDCKFRTRLTYKNLAYIPSINET